MSMDFDDYVIVVTGGSSGLGRAIAVEVAGRGAKAVVINYARNVAEAEETADLVRTQGAEAILVQADVSDDTACRSIARAAEPYGRINALFNNAGVTKFSQDHSDLDAVSGEDFLRLYHVNVVGAYQMIRAARALLEAGNSPGAVVNTSSLSGINGIGSSVAYAASKGALNTMTISLARALAPTIRVNAICPGFIDTPWHGRSLAQASIDQLRENVLAMTPLRVASTAADIAVSAVFLASPYSRHITGETLIVDAGLHLAVSPHQKR
jgi:3-oxoacyl-[acyl-carrier protein] reductase